MHRLASILLLLAGCFGSAAFAGDPVAGMALFNNVPDAIISCGNSSCHGPNPNDNVNGLQKAGNNAGVIEAAIRVNVPPMMFFNGLLNPFQLEDLAAYLAPQPEVSETAIAFGTQAVSAASDRRSVRLSNLGGVDLSLTGVSIGGADAGAFALAGTCGAAATLPSAVIDRPGGTCDVEVVFSPSAARSHQATLTLSYAGSTTLPSKHVVALSGQGIAAACTTSQPANEFQALSCPSGQTGAVAQSRSYVCSAGAWTPGPWTTVSDTCRADAPAGAPLALVEYHNGSLDHYFVTADSQERAAIESGLAGPGWERTATLGHVWNPQTAAVPNGTSICRFYGNPKAGADGARLGPNSHFYTADPDECAAVKHDPGWVFEGLVFDASKPNTAGACTSPLVPVRRHYNRRFAENDSNHRYTVDPAIAAQMTARGWSDEGVVLCIER